MQKKQLTNGIKLLIPKKVQLIMKLTIMILFLGTFCLHADNMYSQNTTVNLEMRDASYADVFREIEKQSEFRFFFNNAILSSTKGLNLNTGEKTIAEVLDQLFEGTDISYKLIDKYIVITSKNNATERIFDQVANPIRITGSVTDDSGIPMPGVNIKIKGGSASTGVVTDLDGKYSINIPAENVVLTFSFIGYITQEHSIGNQRKIDIVLNEDIHQIEEVVVVGYGVQKKVNLTGSVASVRGSDLKVTSSSTAQALQGRIPGVQITQNTGTPGATSTIKIRGVGSLKSDNSPLIVVDGFIADKIDDIAAGDIESVSVLKDAASGAIYGSRGANGVVLITTKRGNTGKMQVDLTAEYGFQKVTTLPDYLNSRDYAQKQNEQRAHSSLYPLWAGDLAPETLSGGTDWFDYLYGNSVPIQNYHLGISGGSEATKYAISLNYIDQEGILKPTSYNRLNLRSNFDHKFSERVKVSVNIDLKNHNSSDGTGGFQSLAISAVRSSPTIPITFPDGYPGIYLQSKPGEISTDGTLSPNWLIGKQKDKGKGISARATAALEVGLFKGLAFKSVFNGGINYNSSSTWKDKYSVSTPEQPNVTVGGNSTNSLQENSGNSQVWEIQELLTYNLSVDQHNISALAGFSAEKGKSENTYVLKEDFPNNDLQVLDAGNKITRAGGNDGETAVTSLFGQVNYDYAGKYLFQANFRRDGSSVFAPGHQFGTFPSFSAAWRLSEEGFMKQNIPLISNLKVRIGYGKLGNAGIPQYAWLSSYTLTDGHAFGPDPQSFYAAYYLTQMPNENIKWETTTTSNLGIDLGFFENRLNVVGDFYVKSTTDLLLDATIPKTAGYTAGPVVNIGEVENKGWELTVSWNDKAGDFEYGASVNLSHNKNKVVDMGGIAPITGSGRTTREGLPIDSYWGYKTDGIFRTWDEVKSYPHLSGDLRPGDWKYLDISGPDGVPDNKIDANDQIYLGDAQPDLFYGINLTLAWKGIDLGILLNGETGKYDFQETIYGMGPDKENIVQYWFDNRAILGTDGNVISGTTPAMGSNFVAAQYSDGGNLYNTSYLRVKNIQVGYTLPRKWLSKIKINSARIYVNAVNPFLFTDYIGFDPETTYRINYNTTGSRGGSLYYPVSKSYSLGINLKF